MNDTLLLQNPWWNSPRNIDNDKHILKLKEAPFKFIPSVIPKKALEIDSILSIRGPRQVGKTTTIKLLVKNLLSRNVDPQNILYCSMDLVKNDRELFEIYQTWNETRNYRQRRFVFLDEITFVKDWALAVKHIVDLNLNKNTTLILSGSSSIDIHRETERLPGRRGIEKPDCCLFPLNFRDFFHLRYEKLTEPLDLKNLYADIDKKIPTLRLLGKNLQRCFLEYIRIGGFFPAITDFLNVQKIKPLTFESYTDVFLSDLKKVGRDRIIIRDISQKILTSLSSHLSWNNIARQAGNISPITARSYINTLADAFSIYILEFFDKNKSTHNPNKNKKIYPFDPIFYTVMNYLGGFTKPYDNLPRVIEGVCGALLLRNFEKNIYRGLSGLENTYYWKSSKGKEIDFIVNVGNNPLAIEIKYQETLSPFDYITITKTFGEGLVLSKNTFAHDKKIIILPVWAFLYLLPS